MAEKQKKIEAGIWRTTTGVYQVHIRDSQGKQRSKTFDRLVDARTYKAHIRLKKQRGDLVDTEVSQIKFEKWAESYLEQKVALRERTREKYESALRTHLLPTFEGTRVGAISRSDVQSWIVRLKDNGFAPETIRGLYSILAAMMRLAEDEGIVTKSPCRRIELPSPLREEQRYLDTSDIERLARAVEPRYRALIFTASYLGMRWQEIAGLRHRYTNLKGEPATVRVVSTIERARGRYTPIDLGKSKAARRTLKIPSFLRQMLKAHVMEFRDPEWVFPAPKGGFLRYDNFRTRVWEPAVEEAGLSPLTIHELRHTAAALMIDEGADSLQIKRRMGHEDIRTTLNIYGHLFPDREDELVEALDRRRRSAS